MQRKNTHQLTDEIHYILRLTFGVVHAVLITLCSFGLVLFFPSFSQWLFGLFGFLLAPILSFCLTLFCNACIEYVSYSSVNMKPILKTAWIPPIGIFCVSLLLLPLQMMPSLGYNGPLSTLAATFIAVNFVVTFLLQVYAAKGLQRPPDAAYSSSDGASGPM